jgi:8-oxo-dGTP pyrophosphatase MutT (NUDIX family)
MTFDDFLAQVPKIENSSLPGIDSQFKMAPELRKKLGTHVDMAQRKPRKSAVLALFYPKGNEAYLLFMLRKTYKGVHSNQIGFPGGKTEEDDANFKATALRETHEEIGLPPKQITLFKQLTDIYIPPSNFLVKPFMGYTKKEPNFVLQEDEVESLIELPLRTVLESNYVSSKMISTSYANAIDVPVYTFTEPVLWGATAMMVSEIIDLFGAGA